MEQIPDPATSEGMPAVIAAAADNGALALPATAAALAAPDDSDSENRGIVRAAAVLAAGNVASRVLGQAREIVKANLFGTTPLLAAFQAAAYVPTGLFDLIKAQTDDPFKILVGTILSARTKDEVTSQVVTRLFSTISNATELSALSVQQIEYLIEMFLLPK